jgi:rhodanese-related sulfurtransferase
LIIAKFVPGLNTMAAPLAGSMNMRFAQFLRLDFLGALLYSVVYFMVGYLSRDFLAATLKGFHAAGQGMEIIVIAAILVYAVYRAARFQKYKKYRLVPHVPVQELAAQLASEHAGRVQIVDVRSHGYYDIGAERIKGSIRIEPNNLDEEAKSLSRDKDIYLYCTCAREATSARVGHMLREKGFNTFVIVGGLTAWRKAGFPLESIPKNDLIKLPTFA